jgi:hypothetical protein
MRKQRGARGAEVFRITGARQSLADDVRGRQRRYVISMLIRTVAVVLTVALWDVQRPLAIVTLVVGALLPYVAVVVANAGRENAPSMPSAYVHTEPRRQLPSSQGVSEGVSEGVSGVASGDVSGARADQRDRREQQETAPGGRNGEPRG